MLRTQVYRYLWSLAFSCFGYILRSGWVTFFFFKLNLKGRARLEGKVSHLLTSQVPVTAKGWGSGQSKELGTPSRPPSHRGCRHPNTWTITYFPESAISGILNQEWNSDWSPCALIRNVGIPSGNLTACSHVVILSLIFWANAIRFFIEIILFSISSAQEFVSFPPH